MSTAVVAATVCIYKSTYPAVRMQSSINSTAREFRCLWATVWNNLQSAMRDWQQPVTAQHVKRKRDFCAVYKWLIYFNYPTPSQNEFRTHSQCYLSHIRRHAANYSINVPVTSALVWEAERFLRIIWCSSAITWFWECWSFKQSSLPLFYSIFPHI